MQQAVVLDGPALDRVPPFQNGLPASGIDVSWREVADALVVSAVVIVIDEAADPGLKVAGQEVVLEQDAVLHRLMPALDLALRHRVIGRSAHVFGVLLVEPRAQVARDVARSVIRQQPRPVPTSIQP